MKDEEEESSLHTLLTIMDNNRGRLNAAIGRLSSCFGGTPLSWQRPANRLTDNFCGS